MSKYKCFFSDEFEKDLKKITSNYGLQARLKNKIGEILDDPYHYKPLQNVLKHKRRTHIGSFVLIFEIKENDKMVVFHAFKHHDIAYKGN